MSAASFYVRVRGQIHGPFESDKLKRLAAAGKIGRDDEVSRDREKWVKAGGVKGLFPATELVANPAPRSSHAAAVAAPLKTIAQPPSRAAEVLPPIVKERGLVGQVTTLTAKIIETARPVASPAPSVPATPSPAASDTRPCPFCAEPILVAAKKCKHCGEIVDVMLRAASTQAAPQVNQAPAPAVHITNVNHNVVTAGQRKRWSRIVAFLLSLFIPGLGQLYQGRLLGGVFWFIIVVIGYAAFIVPGLVLHLLCAISALLADPYR